MTAEELASVTFKHLRHIRARVDQIADDVGDLKMRMSGVEAGMTRIRREVLQADETDIRQQITLDKLAAPAGLAFHEDMPADWSDARLQPNHIARWQFRHRLFNPLGRQLRAFLLGLAGGFVPNGLAFQRWRVP